MAANQADAQPQHLQEAEQPQQPQDQQVQVLQMLQQMQQQMQQMQQQMQSMAEQQEANRQSFAQQIAEVKNNGGVIFGIIGGLVLGVTVAAVDEKFKPIGYVGAGASFLVAFISLKWSSIKPFFISLYHSRFPARA